MPNKPLRVMYFIGEYARFAGSQKVILNLARRLPKGEAEAIAVFAGEGRCAEMFRQAGVRTYVIEAPAELNVFGKRLLNASAARKAWLFARSVAPYSRKLAAFMEESGVDLVHFSTQRGLLLGFLAARRLGKPVILHVQGATQVLGRVLVWLSGLIPDKILLVSAGLLGQMPAPFRRKCVLFPNTRDPNDSFHASGAPEAGRTTVLVASSLVPFKGYHHLVRAIAAVNAARGPKAPPVAFVGIGETPDHEYASFIASLQKELGVDNFIHAGWQAEPSRYFLNADVVVLPSIERENLMIGGRERLVLGNEGFGLVLLEAMALGKPVVASRIIGPPDLIDDGIDGFLVPPGDPARLAEALLRLINDAGLRARMGAAARSKAESEKFSPEHATKVLMDLYRSLAAPR